MPPRAKSPIGRAEKLREFDDMATIYRATSSDGASVGDADSIDGIVAIVKDSASGHYRIQVISLEPTTGHLRSWEWGMISKSPGGEITLDLPPWLD